MNFSNPLLIFILFSTGLFFTTSNGITSGYQPIGHNVIMNNKINPVYPGQTYPMSKLQEIIDNKQNIPALKQSDHSFYILVDKETGKPIPVEQKGAFIGSLENAIALPAEKNVSLEHVKNFSFTIYQDIDLVEKLITLGRIKAIDAAAYQAIMLYFIIQTSDQTFYKIYLTNPWPTEQEATTIMRCYNTRQENRLRSK